MAIGSSTDQSDQPQEALQRHNPCKTPRIVGEEIWPNDRTGPAKTPVEGFGGKLLSYYFALGDDDGIGIVEFPDIVSGTACSITAASSGGFTRFDSTALMTAKEAEAAMKKAKKTKTGYQPPNA